MAASFYRHGWHSWSPAAWHDTARPWPRVTLPDLIINADDPEFATDLLSGSGLGAIESDGEVTLLGALHLDSRVRMVDGEMIPLGGEDWITAKGLEEAAFASYREGFCKRWGTRATDPGPVWCSWYSFWGNIDEDLMTKTVADVAQFPFSVFQIDAGWERALGDWQANSSFRSGMPAMAERIREKGLRPGLWMAPFAVHRRSELADRYPQFLLLNDEGTPVRFAHNWGDDGLALDVTRSDVLEWVRETVASAIGWGFDYLKLDFLYAGAFPGRRETPMGREEGYRRAIETVRSAAGENTFLLACGAPILASIGLFDAIRIGPDAAPYWEDTARTRWLGDWSGPGARNAIATSFSRLWLQRAITLDPDVAFFRSRSNLLTPSQRRLGQDLALISGFRSTSDPPAWLDLEERQLLEEFLNDRPVVLRSSSTSFEVGGRHVDFQPVLGFEDRPS